MHECVYCYIYVYMYMFNVHSDVCLHYVYEQLCNVLDLLPYHSRLSKMVMNSLPGVS